MPAPAETTYVVASYHSLPAGLREGIDALVRTSITSDYFLRSAHEVSYFAQRARRARGNLSRGIGGPIRERRQSFGRALSVIALRGDRPEIYVPIADNVSNRRLPEERSLVQRAMASWPGRLAERQTKLHSSKYLPNRHAWFGYMAIGEQTRSDILEAAGAVNSIDAVGALALATRHPEQPVSVWPWGEEGVLLNQLVSWNLNPLPDNSSFQQPFGPDTAPVLQAHWVASRRIEDPDAAHSVAEVQGAILAKPGAKDLLESARITLLGPGAGFDGLTFM